VIGSVVITLRLFEVENGKFTVPFSMTEIELVVKYSVGNKSSGSDGFNFAFFRKFWYLVKNDVRILFRSMLRK
jgi:hypothetical protein